MTKQTPQKEVQVTIHLPIDKTLDNYLVQLSTKQERSKIAQIRFILNEYMKNNPL
jgi:hypothetical protein